MTWLRTVTSGWAIAASLVVGGGRVVAQPAVAPSGQAPDAKAEETPLPAEERVRGLSTSDGVALAAWYYPAAQPRKSADNAAPVVILLHDLGGSHESVAPLARALQARGIAVVSPDLRGHGASTMPDDRGAATLKAGDFRNMTVTEGGRIRTEAAVHGDIETVRNWIKLKADQGILDLDRLVLVGCGVGAAIAAHWTVLDGRWPNLASGPQGGQVRGLVLVSPVWAVRGFPIVPALQADPVRKALPVLVIAGTGDDDAVKVYEYLKRQRPDGWDEKRPGQAEVKRAPRLEDPRRRDEAARPTLSLRILDTRLSGDRLAAFMPKAKTGGDMSPAASIADLIGRVTSAEP